MNLPIDIDRSKIEIFCKKWRIIEFSFFGSILRDDFGLDSDVDVLVTFAEEAPWSEWDVIDAEEELKTIIGRDVDLIERITVERSRNSTRRDAILSSTQRFYAA